MSDYFGDGGDVLAAVVFPASLLLCFVALLVNSVDSRRSKTKQTIGEQTATQQYTLNERNNVSVLVARVRFLLLRLRVIPPLFLLHCLSCERC